MQLDLLRGAYAVVRLNPGSAMPEWACGELVSITRTPDEVSIVCESGRVPDGVRQESGWRCLRVRGPLEFSMVGVLAALAEPLARANVPIFVVSTFDTDYILVSGAHVDRAGAALVGAGHVVAHASACSRGL
jgi:uncharacterized protein